MKKYGERKIEKEGTKEGTKYVIVVPTEDDRKELMEAFEHFHYSNIDTDNVTVNQLAHEYLDTERTGDPESRNNIVVRPDIYNSIVR